MSRLEAARSRTRSAPRLPITRATKVGDVGHTGWVVTLHNPEEQTFHGRTLEVGLAQCLVRLMAPEIGNGQYLV